MCDAGIEFTLDSTSRLTRKSCRRSGRNTLKLIINAEGFMSWNTRY
ncbi:hypothetical protein VULLAG_LOCUS13027 [Vulpes lagopus]